ncbi:hypothetical protein ACFQ3Z_37160 [Streptomyces nogalater]
MARPHSPAARPARPHAPRRHLGTLTGVVILGVLLWRLGTGPLLDGLGRIDGRTVPSRWGSAWSPPCAARGAGSWWRPGWGCGCRSVRPSPTTTARCS